ncbi:alpha/beta fold hydrolase [PVC group bacterium]|nr:alpha/beta fold hydrolase [PVC group bacterium]
MSMTVIFKIAILTFLVIGLVLFFYSFSLVAQPIKPSREEAQHDQIEAKRESVFLTYYRKRKPFKIHIDTYIHSQNAPNIMIIPGTGSYGWLYRYFEWKLSGLGYNVFAIDFIGHGRSEGPRGVFTMSEFLEIISMTMSMIERSYSGPIGILGTSQGGEVAFIAALEDTRIKSVVCHNVFDSTRTAPMTKQRILKIPIIGPIIGFLPDMFINLRNSVNWKELYKADSLKRRQDDPRVVWKYSLKSYRTIFKYKPKNKIPNMTTPVMIAVGEKDNIISPKFCKNFYDYLSMEKKKFYVMPGAKHQLLIDYPDEFIPVVDEWFRQTL